MKGVLYFLLGVLTVSFGFFLGQNKDIKKIASASKNRVETMVKGIKKDVVQISNSNTVQKNKVVVSKKKAKSKLVPVNQWVYHRSLKKSEELGFDNARCLIKNYKVQKDTNGQKSVKYNAICQGDFKLQNKVRMELAKKMLTGGEG